MGIALINAAMTTIPEMNRYKEIQTPRFIDESFPDIKDQDIYEITYNKTPITAIKQILTLMNDTSKKLTAVTCPTIAFQSIEDHVVPPENTEYIISHIQSGIKKIVPLYNSYHVASMDFDKTLIAEQCCQFFKELSTVKIKN